VTLPAFKQEVQTVIFLGTPSITTRTFCKLGRKRRLVILLAWDTLFPVIGFFPHISQTLAIFISTPEKKIMYKYLIKRQVIYYYFSNLLKIGIIAKIKHFPRLIRLNGYN